MPRITPEQQAKMRAGLARPRELSCRECGSAFVATAPNARYCPPHAGQKGWQKRNPERHRANIRRGRRGQGIRRYGISVADHAAMLAAQGGVCAICQRPERHIVGGRIRELSIDHDHKTGRVRGLLCWECNVSIGKMGDNPELLRRAADYLERPR